MDGCDVESDARRLENQPRLSPRLCRNVRGTFSNHNGMDSLTPTHSLPLVRPSRAFGFAKFLSPFPQTAQVQPSAQGWPGGGTTLGNVIHYFFQPQRGCSNGATERYNPVGVENIWEQLVAALQPWAELRYPVGVRCLATVRGQSQNKSPSMTIPQPFQNQGRQQMNLF